ncbi:MAG: serine acetyltransferase [Lentisphaeria bacterium]|nr:serine acetyltransferase [Lentisphaeria bacterium]
MENDSFIEPLISRIFESYADDIAVNRNDRSNLPRESEILKALNGLLELIFPGYAEREAHSPATLRYAVGEIVTSLNMTLNSLFLRAFLFNCKNSGKKDCDCHAEAASAARELLEAIPSLRESMKLDIQAAYAGDPAARSLDEIVLSYTGVKAITIQRIAHKLYQLKVPMIPRMMTEYAHRITGIDIHPGAKLGKGVFIDHGTGVVIGETAELGNDVKIYQGVTLGALSFPKDACGMIIKGAKRHPTIEDGVTIYAGATILGAITIGKNSVIGGNVWLTEGTEPGTKITIASPELTINKSRKNPV